MLHAILIVYGIAAHAGNFTTLVPEIAGKTRQLAADQGWVNVVWIVMFAYAASGAT